MLLVDINAFREINECYGHMIGDALLVEVGNALLQRASPDEIVGRVARRCVRDLDPQSGFARSSCAAGRVDFAEVFARGFSTGDREGTEFIALTASLGVAIAPEDGARTRCDLLPRRRGACGGEEARSRLGRPLRSRAWKATPCGAQRCATNSIERSRATSSRCTISPTSRLPPAGYRLRGADSLEPSDARAAAAGALHPVRRSRPGLSPAIDTWVMRNAFAAANELGALRDRASGSTSTFPGAKPAIRS